MRRYGTSNVHCFGNYLFYCSIITILLFTMTVKIGELHKSRWFEGNDNADHRFDLLTIENIFGVLNFFNVTRYISLQIYLSSSLQYNLINIYQIGCVIALLISANSHIKVIQIGWFIMYLIGFVSIISRSAVYGFCFLHQHLYFGRW